MHLKTQYLYPSNSWKNISQLQTIYQYREHYTLATIQCSFACSAEIDSVKLNIKIGQSVKTEWWLPILALFPGFPFLNLCIKGSRSLGMMFIQSFMIRTTS